MTNEQLVEQIARALWERQCWHWGRYRDKIPDLCGWDDLTQSKQREVILEASAILPFILAAREEGARAMQRESARLAESYADMCDGSANAETKAAHITANNIAELILDLDPAKIAGGSDGACCLDV